MCHSLIHLPISHQLFTRSLNDDILIFDEAHNIEQVCTDAASFDLGPYEFAGCAMEIDRVMAGVDNRRAYEEIEGVDPDAAAEDPVAELGEWAQLKQMVLDLEREMYSFPLSGSSGDPTSDRGDRRYTAEGSGMLALLQTVGISKVFYFSTQTPISPICRTPLVPYLTFESCFSKGHVRDLHAAVHQGEREARCERRHCSKPQLASRLACECRAPRLHAGQH